MIFFFFLFFGRLNSITSKCRFLYFLWFRFVALMLYRISFISKIVLYSIYIYYICDFMGRWQGNTYSFAATKSSTWAYRSGAWGTAQHWHIRHGLIRLNWIEYNYNNTYACLVDRCISAHCHVFSLFLLHFFCFFFFMLFICLLSFRATLGIGIRTCFFFFFLWTVERLNGKKTVER